MDNMISIVLPVYNGSDRISKSIDSILAQTYRNWELIVVNDCSTDNTLETVLQYCSMDGRIKIINNSHNQKLPRSLNIGFASASGEYYTWTSDDNQFLPNALERMSQILSNDQSIDLVYADYSLIDDNNNYVKDSPKEEPDVLRFHNVIGACFLYRRSLAQLVGEYDPDFFLAEDYEFFLKCYENGNIFHLKEKLYNYGVHDKSLTATRHKEIYHQTFRVLDKHFCFLYSKCLTKTDKHKLFLSMLNFYNNGENKASLLKRFYSLDSSFRITYFKDTCKKIIKKILNKSP